MKNIFKKNPEIEISFYKWVLKSNHGWKLKYLLQIGYNPFLMTIANLCIYFDWCSNDAKFVAGDKVKYNLFAKATIPSIEENRGADRNSIYTFVGYPEWSKSKSTCDYVDKNGKEGSCSAFWLRKAYFWEK